MPPEDKSIACFLSIHEAETLRICRVVLSVGIRTWLELLLSLRSLDPCMISFAVSVQPVQRRSLSVWPTKPYGNYINDERFGCPCNSRRPGSADVAAIHISTSLTRVRPTTLTGLMLQDCRSQLKLPMLATSAKLWGYDRYDGLHASLLHIRGHSFGKTETRITTTAPCRMLN